MSLIHVARNNAVLGQFAEDAVRAGLASGTFLLSDLAWKDGMAEWKALSQWPEFSAGAAALSGAVPIPASEIPPPPPAPEWERRRELGRFGSFCRSVTGICFHPVQTFSAMPTDGSLRSSFTFYAVSMALMGFVYSLLAGGLVWFVQMIHEQSQSQGTADPELEKLFTMLPEFLYNAGPILVGFLYFLFALLWIPLGYFLFAGILHGCLLLTGGAKKGFQATAAVLGYAGGSILLLQMPLVVLGMIPFIGMVFSMGNMVLSGWYFGVIGIGLVKAHQTTPGRVIGAMAIPLVACCCIYAGLIAILMPIIMQNAQ